MKIPNKLKIGGHIFKIVESDLKNICGETDLTKLTISLDKKLPNSIKSSTLFHEILCHGINSTFTGDAHLAHSYMDSVSEQIYQVLSDNNLLKK